MKAIKRSAALLTVLLLIFALFPSTASADASMHSVGLPEELNNWFYTQIGSYNTQESLDNAAVSTNSMLNMLNTEAAAESMAAGLSWKTITDSTNLSCDESVYDLYLFCESQTFTTGAHWLLMSPGRSSEFSLDDALFSGVLIDGAAANHIDKNSDGTCDLCGYSAPEFTAPTPKTGLSYSGSAQELITAGVSDDGLFSYSLSKDGTYTSEIPTAVNAGSYQVYYKLLGKDKHWDAAGGPISVTIEKAAPEYTAPTAITGLSYTGNPQTLITAGTTNDGTFAYALSEIDDFTADLPTGTAATSYSVYYKLLGDANHTNVTCEEPITVTISKDSQEYTAPSAKSGMVYSGSAQELIVPGTSETGTFTYSKEANGTYTTAIPTGTDAGDYTVYYKITGDPNHTDERGGPIAVTIEKAEPDYTAPAARTNLKATGTAQQLVTAGTSNDGEFSYSLEEDGEYDAAIPTATTAGTYAVYYKLTGDENHKDLTCEEPISVTVTAGGYTITSGSGSTYVINKSSTLSFTCDGDLDKFVGLKIDGVLLDTSYYDTKSGSTIATLKSTYLSGLDEGSHTILFIYRDGSSDEGKFTVSTTSSSGKTLPQTGYIAPWALIVAAAVAGTALVVAGIRRKKKEDNG